MEKATTDHLKKFFSISIAAFEFQMKIMSAFDKELIISNMHQLHLDAMHELELESPDKERLDHLLKLMEIEAEKNAKPVPKFPKGGA